jgi:hypothetical protein
MSYTVDIAQGHKTRGIVVFLLIAFGPDVSLRMPSLAPLAIKYGSVAEAKELGNGVLPDLDARPSGA